MDAKGFKRYLSEGIEIIKLNDKVAAKVAKDQAASVYAMLFFALTGLAQAVGTFNLGGIIYMPISSFVFSFIGVGIMHVLAKIFGGKAAFMEYYRASGIGYVGMWLMVIPIAGPLLAGLLGIWYLVVGVVVLKAVHKLTTGKAIIVTLIPILVAIAVAVVIAILFAAALVSLYNPMFGQY